jgi:hypothetical protein
MSAVHAAGTSALRLVGDQWRSASLRLVPSPGRRAPRAAFVGLVVAVLAVGLVGLLLLTTAMQQRAFALFEIENEIAGLREQRQILTAELAQLEAPGALAEAAGSIGMVPNDTPVFLDLESGALRGEVVPAPWPAGDGR